MADRDSKGRFIKGHSLGKEYAPIQSVKKTKIQPTELKCLACGVTFYRTLNKWKAGKFCTRTCTDSYGARTGLKNPMSQRVKLSEKMKGENNPNWRGGVGAKRMEYFAGIEYKDWRTAVFKRDDYTCVHCKTKGTNIQADHIKPIFQGGEVYDVSNGQTLCKPCHVVKTRQDMSGKWINQYSEVKSYY